MSYSTDLHLNVSKNKNINEWINKSLNSKDEMQLPYTHVKSNRQYDDLKRTALFCVQVPALRGCPIHSKIQQDVFYFFTSGYAL